MSAIQLFVFNIVAGLFRFVPYPLLYVFSDILAFVLRNVAGYRKQVILNNLTKAFPEKSTAEINSIVGETYRNLTDIILETVKSFTTPVSGLQRRCVFRNPETVTDVLNGGKSVLLAGSHTCNWEYAGTMLPTALHVPVFGAYKPLTNKPTEAFLNQKRGRGGMIPIPMESMMAELRRSQSRPTATILISDQSPSSRKRAQWISFFGRDTACLPGADIISRMFDYPVFSYRITRVRRGYYEVTFIPVCMNPSEAREGAITRRYHELLEQEIRENPGNWLWSHKRWKMQRSG
jgi:KDO2-lipid IV(A) lauroyltransferase